MVTGETAAASSSALERDARLVSADQHSVSSGEIALGVVIGRTSEAFDFLRLRHRLRSGVPGRGVPLRRSADRHALSVSRSSASPSWRGRSVPSSSWRSTGAMGGASSSPSRCSCSAGRRRPISFLPSYGDIGSWSIVMLVVCRIGQGLALGGAWDGLASLLALNAPRSRRGWYAMMPQLGAPFGFIVASGLFAFFLLNLSQDDFLSWGWRYPFFVAFTINVVALFARLRLVATEQFADLMEKRDLVPAPVSDADQDAGYDIVHRRLRAAGELRLVPPRHDLPAVLCGPLHRPHAGRLSAAGTRRGARAAP